MRRFVLASLLSVGLLAGTTVHASASITVGSALPAPTTVFQCAIVGGCTFANQVVDPSHVAPGGLTAPSAGVIVRWRVRTDSGLVVAPFLASLRVLNGNTGAGESAQVEVTDTTGVQVFPTRMSITAGRRLGVDLANGTNGFPVASSGGSTIDFWLPRLGATETRAPDLPGANHSLLLNADIEADADADGFGDETQDQCPTNASTQGPCPDTVAPETTITKGPKKKTTKTKARFEFSASEAGSTFECKLDSKGFEPCTSPKSYKAKKGKHTFAVRAKDAAGNTDPTPATQTWKVKKKPQK